MYFSSYFSSWSIILFFNWSSSCPRANIPFSVVVFFTSLEFFFSFSLEIKFLLASTVFSTASLALSSSLAGSFASSSRIYSFPITKLYLPQLRVYLFFGEYASILTVWKLFWVYFEIHHCLDIFQWKVLVIPHTLFISIPILPPCMFSHFLYDKATLSGSAVSSSIQVKYSLSVLPSELAFLFLDAILHLVKETCAWGDGKTTDKCHELHPVISSIWTEGNFHTVPCEQNVRSKFSASRKHRVNVALILTWFLQINTFLSTLW